MKVDINKLLLNEINKSGSQSKFAKMHNLSRAYVSDLVRGRRDISPRIANILGYDLIVSYERKETFKRKENGLKKN